MEDDLQKKMYTKFTGIVPEMCLENLCCFRTLFTGKFLEFMVKVCLERKYVRNFPFPQNKPFVPNVSVMKSEIRIPFRQMLVIAAKGLLFLDRILYGNYGNLPKLLIFLNLLNTTVIKA